MNSLLYIATGSTNANAVHAKAPVRAMNRPNLGIMVALMPTPITIMVRSMIFFIYGVSLNGLADSVKHLVFSVMSTAGIA